MQRIIRRFAAMVLLGAATAGVAGAANAQDSYPNHAVRWLVGYPPGGSTDICARLIGSYLSQALHQQFLIENRPGAGNNLGRRDGRPFAAGWLHGVPGQSGQRHQRHALQKSAVRLPARHGAGRRLHPRAERDGGEPERAGGYGQGIHRLRQGQSRQGQHGFIRHRHLGPSVGCAVHADDRRQSGARAVSRRRSGAGRYAGRPGAGDVRQSAVVDRLHQSRQAARAGGDHGGAFESAARRADRRCDCAGL